MAGPWEKYQSTPAATSPSDGPWTKYQQLQGTQSPSQTGGDIVSAAEQRFGLPAGLLSAVISKESSGNSKAISPKGAIGLGQVMPDTARDMGYDPDELKRNPALQ
ncbi:lytic transglycosylase domain-containing protein, partial [Serratia marcescens]